MKENQQFERGIALFNSRKFFAAHEVWEELWLVEREPEKRFLQGLIQISAAFHHYRRQNLKGAASLLAAGVAKLDGFTNDHRGLALAALRSRVEEWLTWIRDGRGLGRKALPRIRLATRVQSGSAARSASNTTAGRKARNRPAGSKNAPSGHKRS
ncbi:MAG TPA: DUF309 domain-containing protein [Candidatus Acidoferrales bacterium]|nr:DUF309 domain-containing protein [Candidatus Acidoferrales bacterium]